MLVILYSLRLREGLTNNNKNLLRALYEGVKSYNTHHWDNNLIIVGLLKVTTVPLLLVDRNHRSESISLLIDGRYYF